MLIELRGDLARYKKENQVRIEGIQGNYLIVHGQGYRGVILEGCLQLKYPIFKSKITIDAALSFIKEIQPYLTLSNHLPEPEVAEQELRTLLERLNLKEAVVNFNSTNVFACVIDGMQFLCRKGCAWKPLISNEDEFKAWLIEHDVTEEMIQDSLDKMLNLKKELSAIYQYSKDKGFYFK